MKKDLIFNNVDAKNLSKKGSYYHNNYSGTAAKYVLNYIIDDIIDACRFGFYFTTYFIEYDIRIDTMQKVVLTLKELGYEVEELVFDKNTLWISWEK